MLLELLEPLPESEPLLLLLLLLLEPLELLESPAVPVGDSVVVVSDSVPDVDEPLLEPALPEAAVTDVVDSPPVVVPLASPIVSGSAVVGNMNPVEVGASVSMKNGFSSVHPVTATKLNATRRRRIRTSPSRQRSSGR